MSDELANPCHHKNDQRKEPQRHKATLRDGVIAPNANCREAQNADGQLEGQSQIEKGGQDDKNGGPVHERL